ncbi:CDP-archaeol synthase [Candidatus Methylobacter oryzae]|uniref:CDP-archaeol synthase n=1 Tax=Candidatus Methylobacter oryzae TaxID=2497749 RepID=A0ABY3C534_9GAMM|nr:CDP-archaeol synthase [Candidatus Methylobacter oryzae]TRW89920.1 CDP-archaeol synthase [Candidatus Methylobacter oryzae]
MSALSLCFQTIALLVAANGAPVLTNKALGARWAWPVDNRIKLRDGYRLFGNSKTWRGLCSAIFCSSLVAFLSGIEPLTGVLFGALAMVGDLLASFIKRRMGYSESSRARGLDTVPESLLPTLLLKEALALSPTDIVLIVALFFLIEEWVSPILYRLHIRKRPY